MQQPVLETPRLRLRPFVVADADVVQRLASAFEVADTTLNIPHPYPDGAAEQWIRTHPDNFRQKRTITWAITVLPTMDVVGAISLVLSQQHQHAEMGYWLGVPFWNRGYMSEAATSVLKYGFSDLNVHRIYAAHLTRNPASGRVMQKIGMQYEGCQREHIRKGERFEDVAHYGIVRQDEHDLNPAPSHPR